MKINKIETIQRLETYSLEIDDNYAQYITNFIHENYTLYDKDIKNVIVSPSDIVEIMTRYYRGRLSSLMVKDDREAEVSYVNYKFPLWIAIQDLVDGDLNDQIPEVSEEWCEDSCYDEVEVLQSLLSDQPF